MERVPLEAKGPRRIDSYALSIAKSLPSSQQTIPPYPLVDMIWRAKGLHKKTPFGNLSGMDLKTYLQTLETSAEKKAFAEKAKTSQGFLDHIVKGRKKPSSLKLLVQLIEASDGELDLQSLRPDLFPNTSTGKRRLRNFKQSIAA